MYVIVSHYTGSMAVVIYMHIASWRISDNEPQFVFVIQKLERQMKFSKVDGLPAGVNT